MSVVAWIAAAIAALLHLVAFAMESFLFGRPSVQRKLVRDETQSGDVRLWAFNQGFYNFALAAGALVGIVLWTAGEETVGQTLIVFSCASMVLAGVVLVISDRRLWPSALGQAVPSAVAVLATLAA